MLRLRVDGDPHPSEKCADLVAHRSRITQHGVVVEHERREAGDCIRCRPKMAIPQRQSEAHRNVVTGLERTGHTERIAQDEHDGECSRHGLTPELHREAHPRVLDHDRLPGTGFSDPALGRGTKVFVVRKVGPAGLCRGWRIPRCADRPKQLPVVAPDGVTLPVSRFVRRTGRNEVVGPRSRQAETHEHAGRRRRSAAMHPHDGHHCVRHSGLHSEDDTERTARHPVPLLGQRHARVPKWIRSRSQVSPCCGLH